jgi:hypothetical protein
MADMISQAASWLLRARVPTLTISNAFTGEILAQCYWSAVALIAGATNAEHPAGRKVLTFAKAIADSLVRALQKRAKSGVISGCSGADGRPSGVLRRKIVPHCREQSRWTYNGAVFEVNKEIPA